MFMSVMKNLMIWSWGWEYFKRSSEYTVQWRRPQSAISRYYNIRFSLRIPFCYVILIHLLGTYALSSRKFSFTFWYDSLAIVFKNKHPSIRIERLVLMERYFWLWCFVKAKTLSVLIMHNSLIIIYALL